MKTITLDYETYLVELREASHNGAIAEYNRLIRQLSDFIVEPVNDGFNIWDNSAYECTKLRTLINLINELKKEYKNGLATNS